MYFITTSRGEHVNMSKLARVSVTSRELEEHNARSAAEPIPGPLEEDFPWIVLGHWHGGGRVILQEMHTRLHAEQHARYLISVANTRPVYTYTEGA